MWTVKISMQWTEMTHLDDESNDDTFFGYKKKKTLRIPRQKQEGTTSGVEMNNNFFPFLSAEDLRHLVLLCLYSNSKLVIFKAFVL